VRINRQAIHLSELKRCSEKPSQLWQQSSEGTMSKPTGMSDVEWGLRCDLAAAFRLSVRFGFNEGLGNHFSLMLPGHDDRFLVNARGLMARQSG
jgi:hypothetical protein